MVRSRIEAEDFTKQNVLNNREFPKYLAQVHLSHPLVDFFPLLETTDVVKHRRVLSKWCAFLYARDGLDSLEVQVFTRKTFHDVFGVDGPGFDVAMREELGGAEHEGQNVVVIKRPDAVRASRLEPVDPLKLSANSNVSRKDTQYKVK